MKKMWKLINIETDEINRFNKFICNNIYMKKKEEKEMKEKMKKKNERKEIYLIELGIS